MTGYGTPFGAVMRTMLSCSQRSLAELQIRHIRTQDRPLILGRQGRPRG